MKKYAGNLMVALDQLGNALAGGNPDSTISARIGYFSEIAESVDPILAPFWKLLRAAVDFTFYPIDGPGHCVKAYHNDSGERFRQGSDLARGVLTGLVLIFCPVIGVILRLIPGKLK